MTTLPDPETQQPYAPQAGQPLTTDTARRRAAQIAAAVDDIYEQPTAIRITDPAIPSWQDGARIGTTPPVTDQPGTRRPPMSQDAVDYSARILSTSVASVLFSAAGSGLLIASNHANPTTLGLMIAAPAVLSLPILALKSLAKSAKQVAEAAPPTITNHYSGYVDQRQIHVNTRTTGVIATTHNRPELPPAH